MFLLWYIRRIIIILHAVLLARIHKPNIIVLISAIKKFTLVYLFQMEKAKTGSCAQVIRHRDRYTILLQPLPTENYSNFEVRVFLIMST